MYLDPDSSSSDLSESLSSEPTPKNNNNNNNKSVISIGKMTRPTHLQSMILICPMTVIIDVNDAKIRNIGKMIQSDYEQP